MSNYIFSIPLEIAQIKSIRKLESVLGLKRTFLIQTGLNAELLYRPYTQFKGDKPRLIDNPNTQLKFIQKRINERILIKISPHNFMNGGTKGKNILDNALPHIKKPCILKLDLSKYFQSTDDRRVYNFFHHDLSYSTRISALLTRLTTRKHYLPQGAPTSTSLANLINSDLACEFELFCEPKKLKASFWVDDITISGENPQKFKKFFEERIKSHGYILNKKKTKSIKNNLKQFTPGVVVNNTPSVPKNRIQEYTDAIFDESRSEEESRNVRITGQIQHVMDINPRQGIRLIKLRKKLLDSHKVIIR